MAKPAKFSTTHVTVLAIRVVIALLFMTARAPAADWLCTEESSQRRGNQILSCGIGAAPLENVARLEALDNAKKEFVRLCEASDDCNGHKVTIDPRRTECVSEGATVKCHRLVAFTITDDRKDSRHSATMKMKDKSPALSNPENSKNGKLTKAKESPAGIPGLVEFDFKKCKLSTTKLNFLNGNPVSSSAKTSPLKSGRFRMVCSYVGWAGALGLHLNHKYHCKKTPYDGSPEESYDALWTFGYRAPQLYDEDQTRLPSRPFVTCDLADGACVSRERIHGDVLNPPMTGIGCEGQYEGTNYLDPIKADEEKYASDKARRHNANVAPLNASLLGTYRIYSQKVGDNPPSQLSSSDGIAYYGFLDVKADSITQRWSPPPELLNGKKGCEVLTIYSGLRQSGDEIIPTTMEESNTSGCGKAGSFITTDPGVFCLSKVGDTISLIKSCHSNFSDTDAYKLYSSGKPILYEKPQAEPEPPGLDEPISAHGIIMFDDMVDDAQAAKKHQKSPDFIPDSAFVPDK